ncbi:hypothetical protein GMRT_15901 [Giardia muris]|uniref:Uncharacterized protein n=1 Tax=Giardia muris TaxID=5742 RepID=A0A4Z1SWK9_GIAMU|nr:hypothetical protein GMRT_15901 [Giardia muris]|eukprot:TNJ29950.1 hypothetical protein GMRT_15901 [Giardia muris]
MLETPQKHGASLIASRFAVSHADDYVETGADSLRPEVSLGAADEDLVEDLRKSDLVNRKNGDHAPVLWTAASWPRARISSSDLPDLYEGSRPLIPFLSPEQFYIRCFSRSEEPVPDVELTNSHRKDVLRSVIAPTQFLSQTYARLGKQTVIRKTQRTLAPLRSLQEDPDLTDQRLEAALAALAAAARVPSTV